MTAICSLTRRPRVQALYNPAFRSEQLLSLKLALKVQLSTQILEVYQQIAGRLIPHLNIFSQRLADDALQFTRNIFKE
jgi:hypothetical protein